MMVNAFLFKMAYNLNIVHLLLETIANGKTVKGMMLVAKLTPYFYSTNARKQVEFYISALGGEIHQQMTYGEAPGQDDEAMRDKIIHMAFTAAGVNFYIADSCTNEPLENNNGFDLTLEFATDNEAKDAFSKLSAGGTVIMPLEKQFWGTLFGRIQDKYGIKWQITTVQQQG
jgi:PhnB protein